MNREMAEYLNHFMGNLNSKIGESVNLVRQVCHHGELDQDIWDDYIKKIAQMSALAFDVLDTVHQYHPDLKSNASE